LEEICLDKMRLIKYYDVYRSNHSFSSASYEQKKKIVLNILKYLKDVKKKPLIVRNKPLVAQIEPTSCCNLDCEMCIRKDIGVPIGHMSFEDFKKILDRLDSLFKLHLSGQGEPLLNPDFFKMIEYANKRGMNIYFTTNGTLLTENNIRKICENNIGEIGISIDSTEKEEYEKIRKGASYEEVLEGVKRLVDELRRRGKKTIVSTSAVILKKNMGEIPEFVRLAKGLGIRKVGFQTIQEKEDYLDKYGSGVRAESISGFDSRLREKINEGKKIAKDNNMVFIFDEEKSPGCIWPWRSVYITWEGYVTPCCKILDYRAPCFGNFLKDDFWGVWNGVLYQNYRGLLRERLAPLGCRGCDRV